MDSSNTRATKRRRVGNDISTKKSSIESVDQLRHLLRPTKDLTPDVKAAINQFKDFLTAISRIEDLSEKGTKLRLLRSYCTDQSAASKDDVDFPDLISTWSLAVESSNDSICSAVPAVLAQFYKSISGVLEFRDFGLSLGHTLLKRDQVRLLDRGLSAPRTKDHLISPCLRLLTEVVSFDVGALATRAFDRRDFLLKRLDSLLDHQHVASDEDRRRPTVRRMALRLVIANLKFLDAESRTEFVTHGRILRNCLRGMISDGDDIVVDVLKVLEIGLLEDQGVSRATKGRVFNHDSLTLLRALYDYDPDPNHPESTSSVRDAVHEILLRICGSRKGILSFQTGWYPASFENNTSTDIGNDTIDLGLDSPLHLDEHVFHVPIKNTIVSTFAQSLRPENDTLQAALLLQIFKSTPELVADYFSKKSKFSISASDDPGWRGTFAFLFSVTQLPIPRNFGWHENNLPGPPPVAVIIESIIPKPIDRSGFAKFFTSNEEISVLSGSRLLTIALEKLQSIIRSFREHADTDIWQQASTRLIEAFLQRVPNLSEIVKSIQSSSKDNESLRLALFECLATYHRILPEATVDSRFDIGPVLLDTVSRFESADTSSESLIVLGDQILHLATTAQLSSATRWWYKPNPETLSLFTRLLQFLTAHPKLSTARKLASLLEATVGTAGFLTLAGGSFNVLRASLTNSEELEILKETWLLVDNSIYRSIQRPVKYLDRIEAVQQSVSDRKPISLLVAAAVEQWEFALKKYNDRKDVVQNIAEWTVRFHNALESTGENFRAMKQFQDDMLQQADAQSRRVLEEAVDTRRKKPIAIQASSNDMEDTAYDTRTDQTPRLLKLDEILGALTVNTVSLEGADRWDVNTDIELAIESGKVAQLFRGTSSPEDEVRRQTFESLQTLAYVVEQSTYEEKTQLHLLIGEVIQTLRAHNLDTPLPSAATELAVRLCHIIANPVHGLYGKANEFLLRAPSWDLRRLPSTWIQTVLFREPEGDESNAWTEEAEWLIQWLIDGLKTTQDMELYRRSGVYEKVLVIYSKPGVGRSVRKLILALVWRGICVRGVHTLITRVGIQNWLRIAKAGDREHRQVIHQLELEVDQAFDTDSIEKWKADRPILRDSA